MWQHFFVRQYSKKNICVTFRELTLAAFAKKNVVESAIVPNSFKLRTNLSSHVKIVKKKSAINKKNM